MRTEARKSKPRCKTISSKEGLGKTAIEMNAVKKKRNEGCKVLVARVKSLMITLAMQRVSESYQ